jgi:hypothetical protein
LRLAPSSTRLLLPRLGQAIEPSHDLPVQAWWRGIDTQAAPPATPTEELPKEMPWPID